MRKVINPYLESAMQSNSVGGQYGVPEDVVSQFVMAAATAGGGRAGAPATVSASILSHHEHNLSLSSSSSSHPFRFHQIQDHHHHHLQIHDPVPLRQHPPAPPTHNLNTAPPPTTTHHKAQPSSSLFLQQQQQSQIGFQPDSPEVAPRIGSVPAFGGAATAAQPNKNNTNGIRNVRSTTDVGYAATAAAVDRIDGAEIVGISGGDDDDDEEEEDSERGGVGSSGVGNRWPRQETLALLKIRADMDSTFRQSTMKGPLWEDISRKLAELGYHRSSKKCKEKFENVYKYYKRTKEGRAGRQDGKNYRFFTQLDALYGKTSTNNTAFPPPGPPNPANPISLPRGSNTTLPQAGLVNTNNTFTTTNTTINTAPRMAEQNYDSPSNDYSDSSSSSDDSYEELAEKSLHRKRKRKSKHKASKEMARFFERLMTSVIQKQEELQHKFLEAIERRESENMLREEAWKREEVARLGKELELRTQERAIAESRDAAIVAFLQQATGQILHLPSPLPLTRLANPSSSAVVENIISAEDEPPPGIAFNDPKNSKRWPKPEVLALIKLRTSCQSRFSDPGPKGRIWKEISAGMTALGFNRSPNRCKEKWENINKYFKKTRGSHQKRSENSKSCPYFHHLDALYRQGLLGNSSSKQKLLTNEPESTLVEQNPLGPGPSNTSTVGDRLKHAWANGDPPPSKDESMQGTNADGMEVKPPINSNTIHTALALTIPPEDALPQSSS